MKYIKGGIISTVKDLGVFWNYFLFAQCCEEKKCWYLLHPENIQEFWASVRRHNNKPNTARESLRLKKGDLWEGMDAAIPKGINFNPNTSSSGELCLGAFLIILFLLAASGLVKNSSLFAFAKANIINKVWWGWSIEIREISCQRTKDC